MIKCAIIASTNGSVMNAGLQLPYIRERISVVISDRDCGAIKTAQKHCVHTEQYLTKNALEFSDCIADFFAQYPCDLVLSFYTKLFKGRVIDTLRGRLLNFHPSILPACPGMDGYGDTVNSGSKFIGATVHFIDSGVDTGYPLLQCALPFDSSRSPAESRHLVFIAQCKMLVQIVRWFEEGRVYLDNKGHPFLEGARYSISPFSPNLDFGIAGNFMGNLNTLSFSGR